MIRPQVAGRRRRGYGVSFISPRKDSGFIAKTPEERKSLGDQGVWKTWFE